MTQPPTDLDAGRPPLRVAILGADGPGLRIRHDLAPGDRVAPGQVVFCDAKHPEVKYVSPIHGRVGAIEYGARRMLSAFVIEPADDDASPVTAVPVSGTEPRTLLLECGLWPAFTARPFGGPPEPDARPDAILVSTVPASPASPDPAVVLRGREADLADGLEALTTLTDGTVHLCLARGVSFAAPDHARIRLHQLRFGRRWRARSALIAHVFGSISGRRIWSIGYQDVAAIGHLLRTGHYDPIRSVALTRLGASGSETLRVPLGSDLRALIGDAGFEVRTISGPPAQSRFARFLGRHDEEAGLAPPIRRGAQGRALPLIAFNALDRALPFRIPAVPLMRALNIGDPEACARLGCLELLEEDVSHLSAICTSGTDYARRLRFVLDQLHMDVA